MHRDGHDGCAGTAAGPAVAHGEGQRFHLRRAQQQQLRCAHSRIRCFHILQTLAQPSVLNLPSPEPQKSWIREVALQPLKKPKRRRPCQKQRQLLQRQRAASGQIRCSFHCGCLVRSPEHWHVMAAQTLQALAPGGGQRLGRHHSRCRSVLQMRAQTPSMRLLLRPPQ